MTYTVLKVDSLADIEAGLAAQQAVSRRFNGREPPPHDDPPRAEAPQWHDDIPPEGVATEPSSWAVPDPITHGEWISAALTPRCIVESYLFADVAAQIAPGATGKTTLSLYEAVCITLGRPLWGLEVRTPGPVLFVTAEDRRERLVARLREVCSAVGLTTGEMATVRERVRIDDRTADLRRLTAVVNDVVAVAGFASDIADACLSSGFAPVLVQFDPMVSFGVGESRVNDAEQGLIHAARVIVAKLDCCVRYVHHTGVAKALEQAQHQYAGRGGSALADGCRMVQVLTALDVGQFKKATGETLDDGETGIAIARPKISYAPPQGTLYVRRKGWAFESVRAISGAANEEERVARVADQLSRYIEAEYTAGVRLTRNALEHIRPENLSRNDVRAGLAWLESRGRLWEEQVLGPDGKPPSRGARACLRAAVQNGEATARRVA